MSELSELSDTRRIAAVGVPLLRARALVALLVLVTVFSALSPAFFTSGNLIILAKHVAINAILAIGMTFVVLSGGIEPHPNRRNRR